MSEQAINWSEIIPDVAEREEAARLYAAVSEAKKAYADHAITLIGGISMGEVARCVISGVPITPDDEIVEDTETGEVWLRVALGLPPRAAELVDREEIEDDSEFEDAA